MIGPFIFLDIDGVLNGHQAHENKYCGVDPACMKILNHVLTETGAKIVVASAWRYCVLRGEMTVAGFASMMHTHGLNWGSLVSTLGPDQAVPCRGSLVLDWFRNNYGTAHPGPHVAIDDMDLGYTDRQIPFFQTPPEKGLVGLPLGTIVQMIRRLQWREGK